jgi:hypothetical protein
MDEQVKKGVLIPALANLKRDIESLPEHQDKDIARKAGVMYFNLGRVVEALGISLDSPDIRFPAAKK